jgi:hypothetical protein
MLKNQELFDSFPKAVQKSLKKLIFTDENLGLTFLKEGLTIFGDKNFYRDIYFMYNDSTYRMLLIENEDGVVLTFDGGVKLEKLASIYPAGKPMFITEQNLIKLAVLLGDKFVGWYMALTNYTKYHKVHAILTYYLSTRDNIEFYDLFNVCTPMITTSSVELYSSLQSCVSTIDHNKGLERADSYIQRTRELVNSGVKIVSIHGFLVTANLIKIGLCADRQVVLIQ